MTDTHHTSTERSPLLQHSASSTDSLPGDVVPDVDDEPGLQISIVRGSIVIFSMAILILLQASNISLLTTTQSAIAADLDSYSEASWFTSAYLITMSSLVPLAGRASQIFAPRSCVCAGSFFIACGALVTALSPGLAVFILGRVITGVGAACVFPVSIVFVLEMTTKKRRGLFIGLLNSGFTLGVALGAVVAGALTPWLGWRAVFWLQMPLSLVAGIGIFLTIPKKLSRRKKILDERPLLKKLTKIDYAGMVTLTSSLVLLLYSLASPKIPIPTVILSVCLFALFVLIESRYASEPIIPITVLKNRGALCTCFATLGLMLSRWMVLFYTPVYAIAIRNWSPASAGTMLIPTNGGFAFGGLMVGWIHVRKASSYYLSCLIVLALFSITLFVLSAVSNPSTAAPWYLLLVFVNGTATGSALNYTLAHLLHLTPPSTHVIATSLLITFRGFAGSIGSATAGGIFGRVLQATLEEGFEENGGLDRRREVLVKRLIGSPALVGRLNGVERLVAVHAYVEALKAIFAVGGLIAAGMVLIQAGTGWKSPGDEKGSVDVDHEREDDDDDDDDDEQRNGHVD